MLRKLTTNALPSSRLMQYYHRLLLERTIRRTFAGWKHRYPRWVNTGFDEYFLLNDALPLLQSIVAGEQAPEPLQLAHTWVTAYGIPSERVHAALAELMPVAADFILQLQVVHGPAEPGDLPGINAMFGQPA